MDDFYAKLADPESSRFGIQLRAHHIELLSHALPTNYSLFISEDDPDPREYLEQLKDTVFRQKRAQTIAREFVKSIRSQAKLNPSRIGYVREVLGETTGDAEAVEDFYALILQRLFSLPENEPIRLSVQPDILCRMCDASTEEQFAPHCNQVNIASGDLAYIYSIREIRGLITQTFQWADECDDLDINSIAARIKLLSKEFNPLDASSLVISSLKVYRPELDFVTIESALFKVMQSSQLNSDTRINLYKSCIGIWKDSERLTKALFLYNMFNHVVDEDDSTIIIPLWFLFDRRFCNLIRPKMSNRLEYSYRGRSSIG